MDLERALSEATQAALLAGDLLRLDLHRPGGPRGGGDKAEADTEAEWLIRQRLTSAFPDWGLLGEETGRVQGADGKFLWLVDPNDGTRDYLQGARGSAVSIGLLYESRPVLGVVFAFAYPDGRGDLFTWALGCGPLRRNGQVVTARAVEALSGAEIILLASTADRDPEGNLSCTAPARYRVVPSIAHRLALVAAGEAAAAVSLSAPGAWDYAAGQALLRPSGAVLVNEDGQEIGYGPDGWSKSRLAFAGSVRVAQALAARPWGAVGQGKPSSVPALARLGRGQAVEDPGLLARGQGCLLGQVAGDSLGALVEFQTGSEIATRYPQGPRWLEDGGVWSTLAGQPTDDSEMALALGRSILARGGYDPATALAAYHDWSGSSPFDIGRTVASALAGRPTPHSAANGSLMRMSALGVFSHCLSPHRRAELARQDSAITHPNPVCGDACGAFCVAVGHAVQHGPSPEETWAAALDWARTAPASIGVIEALQRAVDTPPLCDEGTTGFVLVALQNAFFQLLHAKGPEEGMVATVRRGGDTDTNAAIAGALLGAVHGRDAVPSQWRNMILSCRPLAPTACHPRPIVYWPVDVLELAERLLLEGRRAA
jgi:ADP-ribosyl-[dinitrogen reductase] hydrolase